LNEKIQKKTYRTCIIVKVLMSILQMRSAVGDRKFSKVGFAPTSPAWKAITLFIRPLRAKGLKKDIRYPIYLDDLLMFTNYLDN
jgi:hypothetical protein